MRQLNLYEAKTHLSQLVQAALDGEEVYIARAGKSAVRLVPVSDTEPATGGYGCIALSDDALADAFTAETDAVVAALFLGKMGE